MIEFDGDGIEIRDNPIMKRPQDVLDMIVIKKIVIVNCVKLFSLSFLTKT